MADYRRLLLVYSFLIFIHISMSNGDDYVSQE